MTWLEPSLAGAFVLVADQVGKELVLARLPPRPPRAPIPFLSIRWVLNRRGLAAGLIAKRALVPLWIVLVAASVWMLHAGILGEGILGPIGIGAVLGGAAGNLLDQLRRGAIVDFIEIGPWPAFNLADAAIVGGIGLVLWSMY